MTTSILVVEDEFLVRENLCECLRGMGYQVAGTAEEAEEAIRLANEKRPDLVLMDIRLARGSDGVEAAAEIRKRFRLPVIYLTAHSEKETVERAGRTYPYGYLVKPFREDELRATVETTLHRARLDREERERRDWLTRVLEHAGTALIVADTDHRVTYLNPIAEDLLGCCTFREKVTMPMSDPLRG